MHDRTQMSNFLAWGIWGFFFPPSNDQVLLLNQIMIKLSTEIGLGAIEEFLMILLAYNVLMGMYYVLFITLAHSNINVKLN